MRDFQFDTTREQEKLENILKERKRRIAKQQVIFTLILLFIGVVFCLYIFRKVAYTELDGYVKIDVNLQRTPRDIFLTSVNVKIGDYVLPGDTLYSYLYLDALLDQINLNREPQVVLDDRNMRVRYGVSLQEVNVLRTRIRELERQIALEDHNISFGLSDNAHKLDLERLLKESREAYKAKLVEARLLREVSDATSEAARRSKYDIDNPLLLNEVIMDTEGRRTSMVYYRLATDTAIVTDIQMPENTIVLANEEIMKLQMLDLDKSNLYVIGYVPVDKMDKLNMNSEAEVYVNDDVSFRAKVTTLAVRTSELPSNLQSTFSRNTMVLLAVFEIEDGQIVPFWALTADLPVSIRIPNIRFKRLKKEQKYIWFKTGEGLFDSSKEYLKQRREKQHMQQRTDEAERNFVTSQGSQSEVTDAQQSGSLYHVLVACFKDRNEAKTLVEQLKRQGYSGAKSIETGTYLRVAIASCSTETEAETLANEVRKTTEYKDAWMWKQERK